MYGLRGHDGRLYGGLGVFSPPAQPAYRDPGYPPDPAIVAANNALNTAYQIAIEGAQAQNNLDQCRQNAENANSPQQYAEVMARCAQQYQIQTPDVPASSTPPVFTPPAMRGGQLTFTTSRGGTSLQVGDTWNVAIIGASPNSPVTVSGWMPGGTFPPTAQGSTDASGNFSKSGTVGTGEIGKWQEIWAVGGVTSGAIVFTVAAVPTQQVIFKTGGSAPASDETPSDGGGAASIVGAFDFSKIPWWGWGLGVGALVFMFGGGRGR